MSNIKLSEAYSIPKSKRIVDFVNSKEASSSPPPNKYDLPPTDHTSKVKMQPSWSVSKMPRFESDKKKSIPGPGTYSIPQKLAQGPRYTIGSKPEVNYNLVQKGIIASPVKTIIKPGPADYSPPSNFKFKQISYSISASNLSPEDFALKRQMSMPGPGQYENSNICQNSKTTGQLIGKQVRNSYFLRSGVIQTPDPTQYDKPGFEKLNSMPRYSIGKSQRDAFTLVNTPGPSEYKIPSKFGQEAPKFTIPGRNEPTPKSGENTPSPWTYNPTKNNSQKLLTFPKFRGNTILADKARPGVGDYNLEPGYKLVKSSSAVVVIANQSRPMTEQQGPKTPGPGAHQLQTIVGKEGPRYSIRRMIQGSQVRHTPGPQDYNLSGTQTFRASQKFTVAKEPRVMNISDKSFMETAGAGFYNVESQFGGTQKFTIGRKLADPKDDKLPGPGTYNQIHQVGNHNNFSQFNQYFPQK